MQGMQGKEQELQEFCVGLVWVRMGLCCCGCCAPISFEPEDLLSSNSCKATKAMLCSLVFHC